MDTTVTKIRSCLAEKKKKKKKKNGGELGELALQ